jgi:hypothetical protein
MQSVTQASTCVDAVSHAAEHMRENMHTFFLGKSTSLLCLFCARKPDSPRDSGLYNVAKYAHTHTNTIYIYIYIYIIIKWAVSGSYTFKIVAHAHYLNVVCVCVCVWFVYTLRHMQQPEVSMDQHVYIYKNNKCIYMYMYKHAYTCTARGVCGPISRKNHGNWDTFPSLGLRFLRPSAPK